MAIINHMAGSKPKPNEIKPLRFKSDPLKEIAEVVLPQIHKLYIRTLNIVSREITEISKKSRRQKLDAMQAADLRGYAKLLGEMAEQQEEMSRRQKEKDEADLSKMPDDELEKRVRKILKEKKK